MNLKQNQKGFTIVELLIVIVVIAILAAISIVAFTGIQQRGRDSGRASDVSNIVKALTAYVTDEPGAPNNGGGGVWPADAAAAVTALNNYSAANLSSEITSKLTLGAAPTGSTPDQYSYIPCTTGGTVTGAEIGYWKENGGAPEEVVAGNC